MAATGLLGVNPYYKGVELDVSKPVNLAIQIEQREQAKREAIDKYFMDYEKSLNPAGMRQQDQDVFLRKLQDNKAYYLKNRDRILNPAKYGAEAQSEYMARFKDILSDIDRSKQLAANGKVIQGALLDARKNNRTVPQEVLDGIYKNELSMGDQNHTAFDPVNFDAYDKHDPLKFASNIYSKIKPSESPATKVWNPSLKQYQVETVKDYNKNAVAPLRMEVASELRKDRGLQDQVKVIMSDPNQLAQVANEYQKFTGVPMSNNPEDIALGYTIALKPPAVKDYKDYNDWKEHEIFKVNLENQQARKGVQGIGTDIIKSALNNPRTVRNFGKNETWHDLNLPAEVTKDFTVPGVQKVWVKNTEWDPKDPDSPEFISKPTDRQTQLPVSNITIRNNKIYGFIKPVDANGNPVAGKADQVEIPLRVLASKIHKATGASDSKSAAGVDQITEELQQGMKQILPKSNSGGFTFKGKSYTQSQLEKAAKASGMTVNEYINALK